MTGDEKKLESPRKHRQRGKNRRIGFSQEVVTKNVAETLLSQDDQILFTDSNSKNLIEMEPKMKQSSLKKKRKNKGNDISSGIQTIEKESEQNNISNSTKKKRKKIEDELSNQKIDIESQISDNNSKPFMSKKPKNDNNSEDMCTETEEKDEEESEGKKDPKSSLSKRALKKMKHQKLLEEKKNKLDLTLKQKAFNYLSNWKHNKSNWKFEKLKQIWILQNLYDATKVEDSIWNIVVEYFSNSKGKVHKTILDEAIKIVESENVAVDNKEGIKFTRARDIIQNLQD